MMDHRGVVRLGSEGLGFMLGGVDGMESGRKKAFTIVELLTVMAILGLLMAILFPTLSKARQQAKLGACLSKLKGLGNGSTIYLNENRDTFYPYRLRTLDPTHSPAARPFVNQYGREQPRWQWFIETDSGPVIDPSKFKALGLYPFGDDMPGIDSMSMANDVFLCPALDDPVFEQHVRDGAYGYNYQYLGNTRNDRALDRWDNFAVGLHQMPAASQTVLIADSRGAGPRHGRHSFTLDPPRLAIEKNAMRFGPEADDEPNVKFRYSPAEARHGDLANVVFVDAHAESMRLTELGYEVSGETVSESSEELHQGVPRGSPVPVLQPDQDPYEATNKLWNGKGIDPLAKKPGLTPEP